MGTVLETGELGCYRQLGVHGGEFPRRSPMVEQLAKEGKIPPLSRDHFQVVLQQIINGTEKTGFSYTVCHTHSLEAFRKTQAGGKGLRPWRVLQTGSLEVLRAKELIGYLSQTKNGAPVAFSDYKNRLAADTHICWAETTEEAIAFMNQLLDKVYGINWNQFVGILASQKWVRADRQFGGKINGTDRTYTCSVYCPVSHAHIAAMWAMTGNEPAGHVYYPDLMNIRLPSLHTPLIVRFPRLGVGFILGTSYVGEDKKMGLAHATYLMQLLGDIGMHAGSKKLIIDYGNGHPPIVKQILFLGLSGTGKSTLSNLLHEASKQYVHIISKISQDDFVSLTRKGEAIGLEPNGFYIISAGIEPYYQKALYIAAQSPNAMHENPSKFVPGGELDFVNEKGNMRSMILTTDMGEYMGATSLDEITDIVLITRNPLAPAIVKLTTPEQQQAYFAFGETIKTAAVTQDPTELGMAVREEGTNPFFLYGPGNDSGKVVQSQLFMEVINTINESRPPKKKINMWVLNTGYIGRVPNKSMEEQRGFKKVTINDSDKLLIAALTGTLKFEYDPLFKVEVPVSCEKMPHGQRFFTDEELKEFTPRAYLSQSELERALAKQRKDRLAYFEKLEGESDGRIFDEKVKNAV